MATAAGHGKSQFHGIRRSINRNIAICARRGIVILRYYDMPADAVSTAELLPPLNALANPHRLDLDWVHCKRARQLGVTLVINPDAHSTEEYANVPYGVDVARRGWLGKDDVFNTKTLAQVTKALKSVSLPRCGSTVVKSRGHSPL